MKHRIKVIIDKLQPYVNGKLITHVFVRYWEELKEEIQKLEDDLLKVHKRLIRL